ncbi:MAG: hypothetical protein HY695_23260 [Deltaproteobacteria bacterium]|nr:hypothetical protein [Deltaproteobacteria bacterium]
MKAGKGPAASLKEATGAVVLVAVVAACAATAPRDIATARKQLDAHLAQCTARYGYPEATSDLGPYVLGAGEREWRECVYQGVEKYMIPNTASPEAYRKAIEEDREMSASVVDGKMTRAQRQARVQELLEGIERTEEANRSKREQQMEAMDRLVKEELRREQDMMLRTLRPLTR